MKKLIFFVLLILSFCLYSCDGNTPTPTEQPTGDVDKGNNLRINEICSSNKSILSTSDYKYYDWVELYNPTNKDINLKNYGLSDKESNLFKYKFSNTSIKSKEFMIVYFESNYDGDDKNIADFGLSDKGETLYLTKPNGSILDKVEFPSLDADTTYGVYNNEYKVLNPSPNKKNEDAGIYKHIEAPTFSVDSGFYDDKFYLSLSTKSEAKIYYTLDSSDPTVNSMLYDDEILVKDVSKQDNVLKSRTDTSARGTSTTTPVDKAFIVRAIAIDNEGNKSEVVTKSYFIGKGKYKNKNIVSLVTDSSNLIDENNGIYVTGKAYNDYVANGSEGKAPLYNWDGTGRAWEREGNFSLIKNGSLDFSQDIGMRIHGYGGRTSQIKSLNIYARDCYSSDTFTKPIFKDTKYTNSLVLKYDRYSNSQEKFRDGFLQGLMSDSNVDYQKYEMCYLFLNGEYWAEYMIMQKYTDDYIEEKYNIPKDDVVIIKEGALEEGTDKDLADYNNFKNFVKTKDLSKDSNYKELLEKVDIDSFIDFYITQLYYNHFDFSYNKNVLVWKSRTKGNNKKQDGKWRWMLYDFDYAAVNRDVTKTTGSKPITIRYDYAYNTFTGVNLFAGDFKNDIFFHSFMKNKDFEKRFVNRFMDLANTTFSGENVGSKLIEEYNKSNTTLNEFFDNRFSYITKYLAEYIKIEENLVKITVKTNKTIVLNSLTLNENYEGFYYQYYNIGLDLKGNQYTLKDLEVVSNKGILTLKITGANPTIEIK